MKLSDVKPHFESSGGMEEQFFSIEDQGMIFDILRSKMYSNPILAICREITSNARDAHREINQTTKPVEIHLPNGLEPYYSVKDFGPGISTDRMTNIFIKYTASTKRNDNIQTGGFGLGAKTPFSYSDQFSVITVHNGNKYDYACAIDETKVGKLVLLDQINTDETNGTEIRIPVKPQDFPLFRQWTEQACRHWDVKPVIKGAEILWTVYNKVIEGSGWAITSTTDYNRDAKLIIDGIEYPLEINALRKYADPKLIDFARGNFIMYFGVGELSLSANREQIFLDKATQAKIQDRLSSIQKEIKQLVENKIDAFPNLWEANIYFRKVLLHAFVSINFLGKLQWKNHILHDGYLTVKCKIFSFAKRNYGRDPAKIYRNLNTSLYFEEGSLLYINDLNVNEPTPKHLKKIFDDNPKCKNIQVICPNDKQSEDDLNKSIFLDQMQPKRLSSEIKISGKKTSLYKTRLLVFKYDEAAAAFKQVSFDSMEDDSNEKVLCLLNKNSYDNERLPLINKFIPNSSTMKSLAVRYPKYSFYGVDSVIDSKRIDEEFEGFITLEQFITEKLFNNKTINFVELTYAHEHYYDIDNKYSDFLSNFEKFVQDPNSIFLNHLRLNAKMKKMGSDDFGILEFYEAIKGVIDKAVLSKFEKDNPAQDIIKNKVACYDKYPLLQYLPNPGFNVKNKIIEQIADYINLVDKS